MQTYKCCALVRVCLFPFKLHVGHLLQLAFLAHSVRIIFQIRFVNPDVIHASHFFNFSLLYDIVILFV